MSKDKVFVAGVLVIVLVLGMMLSGCATNQYGVEISNVNFREVYIRNAGTNSWGNNIAQDLKKINRSRYSDTVDIRVVSENGLVYSKYNVPFDYSAFVKTGETKELNLWAGMVLAGGILAGILIWSSSRDKDTEEQNVLSWNRE